MDDTPMTELEILLRSFGLVQELTPCPAVLSGGALCRHIAPCLSAHCPLAGGEARQD